LTLAGSLPAGLLTSEFFFVAEEVVCVTPGFVARFPAAVPLGGVLAISAFFCF
jgi:hypothetical protein